MIRRFFVSAVVLSFAVLGAHAQSQAQVAFVGGYLTYQWQQQQQFQSKGWGAYGFEPSDSLRSCNETSPALTVVNQIIASGQRPIIHLMVGEGDADSTDDGYPGGAAMTDFEGCFEKIVKTVQAANLKLIVGTEPFAAFNNIMPYNQFMYAYCQAHGIPVVDYYTMMQKESAPQVFSTNPYWSPGGPGASPTLSAAGWALMSNLAAASIAQSFNGATLKSGYLGNSALEAGEYEVPSPGVNTVVLDTVMQWYAYGRYSDGSMAEINNASINGVFGTWLSTNPAVMRVNPDGSAWAIGVGTTNIKFTTLSGATIDEWGMTVLPECVFNPNCSIDDTE